MEDDILDFLSGIGQLLVDTVAYGRTEGRCELREFRRLRTDLGDSISLILRDGAYDPVSPNTHQRLVPKLVCDAAFLQQH